MRVRGRNRILIAWVLLFTLLPISFVKAVHFHEVEESVAHAATDGGHCTDDCPICQFLLSPFLTDSTRPLEVCRQLISRLVFFSDEELFLGNEWVSRLRAPPSDLLF